MHSRSLQLRVPIDGGTMVFMIPAHAFFIPETKCEDMPPSLEDVEMYCLAKGYSFDPEKFYKTYDERGWLGSKGLPIKSWKSACDAYNGAWLVSMNKGD